MAKINNYVGGCCNFVLAFVIYVFMFGYWGEKQQEQSPLAVGSEVVNPEEYPLKSGDEILSINKKTLKTCVGDVKMELILGEIKIWLFCEMGRKKMFILLKKILIV